MLNVASFKIAHKFQNWFWSFVCICKNQYAIIVFIVHYRDQLGQHLDNMQGDLEALKEFLRDGENYQVDSNTLLNVSICHKPQLF